VPNGDRNGFWETRYARIGADLKTWVPSRMSLPCRRSLRDSGAPTTTTSSRLRAALQAESREL